ncbi:MAG TPA: hypothetical protein VFK21_00495 [Gammaproteobacteria bacterium]|nr:hypothetical protein [Gammaproteobacteria bacterium]
MSKLPPLRTTPPYDPTAKMATLINRLLVGSLNSLGSVTLTDNGTVTTLSDNHITRGCKVFLFPTTAHAATVTGLWADPVSVPANGGSITLTHAAVAQPDLNFDYLIVR